MMLWSAKCKAKFARCFTEFRGASLWIYLNVKKGMFHPSICVFNLPIFEGIIFVTFVCHFEYRVNWHAKSLPTKALQKLARKCKKKFAPKKLARLMCKKVRAKFG